ncbi:hypothetical protein AB0M61_01500 [Streptomyces sp. NPDC051642]|uniref:hypothetical protein n=1 Tax=Streptomyces sp. NPDC051642 TaxID=3154646 RepID=UPI0034332C99
MTDEVIPVRDEKHPTIQADMVYSRNASGELALAEVRLRAAEGGTLELVGLAPLPLSRWDRMARFQAATSGGESLDEIALERVRETWPELGPHCHGNAKRRWQGLVGLARFAEEYGRLAGAGCPNPAVLLGEHHDISAGTVRSWLHRARREGLAPKSTHANATVNKQGATS